jgi:hypothetical protein
MSNETQNPYQNADQPQYQPQYQPSAQWPDVPPQAPKVPKKPSKFKRFGLPVGLLLLGLVIGGASGASAVPDPVQVVKEVPGPERVVEKKVTVPTTPASCVQAIDDAEKIIASSGRAVGVMSDMFGAAAKLDAATINRLSPKIDDETAYLNKIRPSYQSSRDSCRASR